MMIAVIGARKCDQSTYDIAFQAGQELARKGYTVICGGLGGVMEAVCKGAKSTGGRTVGILPGTDPAEANPFIDIPIATGLGAGRNLIIIHSAQAVLAVAGSYGTLSELAFALQLNKPVVGLATWDISEKILTASSPQQAVEKIGQLIAVP
jgi:uncharacterized protein (TIGR00725 family)